MVKRSHKLFGRETEDIFNNSDSTSVDIATWIVLIDSARQTGPENYSEDVLTVLESDDIEI
jgi:hypothetical protein